MTKKEYDILLEYDKKFLSAVNNNYVTGLVKRDRERIKEVYDKLMPKHPPYDDGCSTCVLRMMRHVGTLFLQEKEKRNNNKGEKK